MESQQVSTVGYQVIARKYRPRRFSEVVGQEHVVRALTNAIRLNRIAHAYIFCGPRGTGKTTIARIFAKCLNCTNGPSVDFSDDDPRCIEIAEGRSLDVLEIDGASNNGVEQVRELRETVKFPPVSSRFKIYIIDEVHMLTTAAFNALLKTLEEPPEYVKFMFATTDPEKVLPTIMSRCQRFDLHRLPARKISEHLAKITRLENVEAEPAALDALARYSDGCLRDALSALEQLISFCGDRITEKDVDLALGLPSRQQVFALAEAVLRGQPVQILNLVDRIEKEGKELGIVLSSLLQYLHDLLLFQWTGGIEGALYITEADQKRLQEHADLVQPEALLRMLEVLSQAEGRIRMAQSRRVLVEVALLRAAELREAVSIEVLLRKLREAQQQTPETPRTSNVPSPAVSNPMPAASAAIAPSSKSASTQTPSSASSRPSSFAPSSSAERASQQPSGVSSSPSTASKEKPEKEKPEPPQSPRPEPSGSTAPASSKTVPQPELPPTQPALPAASPSEPSKELQQLWQQLLQTLEKRRAPATLRNLQVTQPVRFDGKVLTLSVPENQKKVLPLLESPRTKATITRALAAIGYTDVKLQFEIQTSITRIAPAVEKLAKKVLRNQTQAPSGAPASSASSIPAEDPKSFQDDPAIQEALKIFKAKIVKTIPMPNDRPNDEA